MNELELHREPPTNLDTLIVGLGGWIDAGEAATSSIRNMIRRLPAVRIASIDPEEFFDFTQSRPTSRITAEGARKIRWPRSEFFGWQRPENDSGILLFRSDLRKLFQLIVIYMYCVVARGAFSSTTISLSFTYCSTDDFSSATT